MKKIIAFSLWGDAPMYWVGARRNIQLASRFYEGWTCRFYVHRDCSAALVDTLAGPAVEVVRVSGRGGFDGAFWRFLAAGDPEVEIMISRDCDSRLGPREVWAVDDWLASGKDVHIMRDHPWHDVPILGGMWGVRGDLLRDMKTLVDDWQDFEAKGSDQRFLAATVYPRAAGHVIEHSGYGLAFRNPTRPFSCPLERFGYVGGIFDENEQPDLVCWNALEAAASAEKPAGWIGRMRRLSRSLRDLRRP